MASSVRCAMCGREMPPGRQVYTLRVDLFAAVGELEIDPDQPAADSGARLQELADQLAAMDADDLEEESDRVFERYSFSLCGLCRASLRDLLRGRGQNGWTQ